MFNWLAANTSTVSAIAHSITALVAVCAAVIAFITIRATRRNQREATAKALWHKYEEMAFENPMFASPPDHPEVKIDLVNKMITLDCEESSQNEPRLRFEKYEWYVSLLLNACEEMHALKPKKDWISAISTQIKFHAKYLESTIGERYLEDKRHYNKRFAEFVKRLCLEARNEAAASKGTAS